MKIPFLSFFSYMYFLLSMLKKEKIYEYNY